VLRIIAGDVGRAITDINLPIDVGNLRALIVEVIETVATREQEVQDKQGRWFSLRIRPYKTLENRIDGAVVVLVDIDEMKRAQLPPAAPVTVPTDRVQHLRQLEDGHGKRDWPTVRTLGAEYVNRYPTDEHADEALFHLRRHRVLDALRLLVGLPPFVPEEVGEHPLGETVATDDVRREHPTLLGKMHFFTAIELDQPIALDSVEHLRDGCG